ncbi:MAG: hypothetical protein PHQ98_02550 [Candidatus ainarchaeum sp.]|nr:hypothetical protein [Candidatus ainarchaeum sp.]
MEIENLVIYIIILLFSFPIGYFLLRIKSLDMIKKNKSEKITKGYFLAAAIIIPSIVIEYLFNISFYLNLIVILILAICIMVIIRQLSIQNPIKLEKKEIVKEEKIKAKKENNLNKEKSNNTRNSVLDKLNDELKEDKKNDEFDNLKNIVKKAKIESNNKKKVKQKKDVEETNDEVDLENMLLEDI